MPPQNPQLLSEIMPAVTVWAEENRSKALTLGRMLSPEEKSFASKIGIYRPELVRVLVVDRMPPAPQGLEQISKELLDVECAAGLTLGYGILVTKGHESFRLIRHELGHVLQVERVGDMLTFLALYLGQVLSYGYDNAPFETEAVNYESD
jgi:hypothetical protein